ncbi:MAG: hypothetical protein JST00_38035 [Deltaproteobacteria bacterium]|nr:hypothetical protein [Deltaproteobacteria bacterium]
MAPSASAGAPYNCPATLVVDSPTTLLFPSPEWSSPRTTLPVVNAWVATAGGLSCSYGPPGSPGVVSIYKNTTATCTPNTARTGFDCDRAP